MTVSDKPLVNRVANSGLVTVNLEDYHPVGEVLEFDLKDYLFMGLILKEKEFRQAMKEHDWTRYEGCHLAVRCSADAVIPLWAYMLVTVHASPFAAGVHQGAAEEVVRHLYLKRIDELDVIAYEGQRIVIKGCSGKPVPPAAYMALTAKLLPVAASIMFGEPCSTVPIYKALRREDTGAPA
ncbi:MAG: hypothetical protein RLY31_2646 [Bacteroidota bacterium]|jgi:hypothetical protein